MDFEPRRFLRAPTPLMAICILALAVGCQGNTEGGATLPGGDFPPTGDVPDLPPGSFLRWSEAEEWLGFEPSSGSDVTIPAGITVALDVDTPALGTLNIDGELVFADADVVLTAEYIEVEGTLRAGSEAAPHFRQATIRLVSDPGFDLPPPGVEVRQSDYGPVENKALVVRGGGVIDLHGAPIDSWVLLGATAPAGATSIALQEEPVGWHVGHVIAIAPTDFEAYEVEERTITEIDGATVTFDAPLVYRHYGEVQALDNGRVLDMRAEVANLTRNIRIEGVQESTADPIVVGENPSPGARQGYGGHTMYLAGSTVRLDSVEFSKLGVSGALGRYPVHFHHAHDMSDSYIRNLSVHHTYQRAVVVHHTDNLLVEENTVYNTVGHGFYLEDGNEIGNRFLGNLSMLQRAALEVVRIDNPNRTNRNSERASAFWITNPDNEFVGNRAVAVANGQGFWFVEPDNGSGTAEGKNSPHNAALLRRFEDNVAHTIDNEGGNLGYRFQWNGVALEFGEQLINDDNHAPVLNFVAWKVSNMAIQIGPTRQIEVVDPVLAEARIFVQSHSRGRSPGETPWVIQNATVVVESENTMPGRPIRDVFGSQHDGPYLQASERPLRFEGGVIYVESSLKSQNRDEFRDTTTLVDVRVVP
ncbi:MAG: G8 domain-containing protein [Myxococcota bacterium]